MAISRAYLTSFKNIPGIFTAIQSAQAPPKFTTRFLEGLGFKNPADRLIIGVLKGLGFLAGGGEPTKRYFEFLDQTQAPRVLADGIREAYGDLFQINTKAQELSGAEVKNKLKTLTQGQFGDSVLDKMSRTFKSLSSLADFSAAPKPDKTEDEVAAAEGTPSDPGAATSSPTISPLRPVNLGGLVYNIQLVLPESRDTAVYDALFKSLRDHLVG